MAATQEETRLPRRSTQADEAAGVSDSHCRTPRQDGTQSQGLREGSRDAHTLTDEEIASRLQRQYEAEMEPATRVPSGSGSGSSRGQRLAAALADAELARVLQEQEEEELMRERSFSSQPSTGRRHAVHRGAPAHGLTCCCPPLQDLVPIPFLAGGSAGAITGCFTGLQLAALCGSGQVLTWLCMIGGAMVGHAYTTSAPHQRPWPPPNYEDTSSDDDSDMEQRGLDAGVIESHTAGHVYHQPPPAAAAEGVAADRRGAVGGGDEERKCMICLEAFAVGDPVRTLPCLHRYHQSCVDEWLSRSRECPICKRDITAAEAIPVAHTPTPATGRRSTTGRGRSLLRWRSRSGRSSASERSS